MLKPGTVMYSDDWLDQCFENAGLRCEACDSTIRFYTRSLCDEYQVGGEYDAINIYRTLRKCCDEYLERS
jgi:hypothetical protein